MLPCSIFHDQIEILEQLFHLQMNTLGGSISDHFPFNSEIRQQYFCKFSHRCFQGGVLMLFQFSGHFHFQLFTRHLPLFLALLQRSLFLFFTFVLFLHKPSFLQNRTEKLSNLTIAKIADSDNGFYGIFFYQFSHT